MTREEGRPDPDALLARIKAEEDPHRGTLRVYLGAAPGVGKTYTMLEEAHRRALRGTDIIVGFVETHGRPLTAKAIEGLEVIPAREIPYQGVTLRELDTEAVIRRNPRVACVDELAHTNAPGSKHPKRHEDVQDILAAGIHVVTTMNVQHLESVNDLVKQVTGVTVAETVPDRILDQADQIELVDMDPQALIRRMMHGNIYPPEQAKRALENFFTLPNLTALREIALRVTAREVEDRLSRFMHTAGEDMGTLAEKVMVAVDHKPSGRTLIRRGWRLASSLKSELVVVYVEPGQGSRQPQSTEDERRLRVNLQLADELGARVVRLRGNVAEELVQFARQNDVAHVVLGHPSRGRFHQLIHGSLMSDILRDLPHVNVHLVAPSVDG
jgi:two-component system sensor histidine kinase KdpD